MKKALPIIVLVLLVSLPLFAGHVPSETAKKVAQTFLNNNGAKASQLNDLSIAAGFQNLYIFTTEEGFVVMSADDCVKPILGYSTTGKFVTEKMPQNIYDWLKDYDEQIQFSIDKRLIASPQVARLWKDLAENKVSGSKASVIVEPLVQTTWNQNGTYDFDMNTFSLIFVDLYNNLCPYDENAGELTVTGCVATAMAQVMKYWNFPPQGIGSHSYIPETRPEFGEQFADFGSTIYDWDNMPNALTPSSTETEKMAVATLMYHCGVAMDMDYDISGNGGSGASSYYIPDRLYTYFGYKMSAYRTKADFSETEWVNMLKTELNASRPVQYNGRGSGGHAFVCDGYDSDNYFHFNWGWGGQNDGYFSLNSLTPGSGGAGGGNYNYSNNQSAVFGIQPSTNNATPSDLNYSLSGLRDVTLSWTGADAVSYNIYRNGKYISNTTTTTYSETAPFGTNVYYIRSVNSQDDLSLSSNSVTVTIDYQLPKVNDLTVSLSDNNATLSWTAPEWCYPETESTLLAYGTYTSGSYYYFGWTAGSHESYWGQRYLPSDLSGINNSSAYKVSFYAIQPGNYEVQLYQGTTTLHYSNGDYDIPSNIIASKSFTVSESALGWYDIDLDTPTAIDPSQDFWVFIYDPEKKEYPGAAVAFNAHDRGGYYSTDITAYTSVNSGKSFLIYTYLTDGIYTYNLYCDGSKIAENLTETSYPNVALNNNAANQLMVTTNYYGGEVNSNRIGFAKGNATIASLELSENDMMTVTENAILTVTGAASNRNPEQLILENGAQLIHNNDGVKATVKKTIEPFTETYGGWHFIASPLTEVLAPTVENGWLSNDYDLYYYDEPTYYWMNYRANPFNIVPQQGYLYANNVETTLQFAGSLLSSANTVTCDDLSHSSSVLNGFNLVGNPLACNASVDKDFYVIDNSGNEVVLAETGRVVKPCEGILVKATTNNEQVTFSKASYNGKDICIDIVATDDETELDRARIRFGEGDSMEKYSLGGNHTQVSFSQDDQKYAVAYVSLQDIVSMNFKAEQDDVYTLKFSLLNIEIEHFLLIDHFTETVVDMTQESSYTFKAQASDSEKRFSLVFGSLTELDENAKNEWFAYYTDGHIIVPNMNSDDTLQIFDITGRELSCQKANSEFRIPNSEFSPGVYVLRLVSDNSIKTQKIVIK